MFGKYSWVLNLYGSKGSSFKKSTPNTIEEQRQDSIGRYPVENGGLFQDSILPLFASNVFIKY